MNDIGILPGSIEEKFCHYMTTLNGRVFLAQSFCKRINEAMEPYLKALDCILGNTHFEYATNADRGKVLPLVEIACYPTVKFDDKENWVKLWNNHGVERVKNSLLRQLLAKFTEAANKAGYEINFSDAETITTDEIVKNSQLGMSGKIHINEITCLPADSQGGIKEHYNDETGELIWRSETPRPATLGHVNYFEVGIIIEDKK
jgi:hypothetical protein